MRFPRHLFTSSLFLTALLAHAADTYRIVHTYPHDQHAFTQGLVYVDGHLYESTGISGQSSLRMLDLESGRILQFQDSPSKYFGEGLTAWGDSLIQLTWQSHTALVYDRLTFRLRRTLSYAGEGWGLTHDARPLTPSDGTSAVRYVEHAPLPQFRGIF